MNVFGTNHLMKQSTAEQDQVTDYQCLHTEADTIFLYIYSQIRRGGDTCPVIIDVEDTNVDALAAYVSHQTEGTLRLQGPLFKGNGSDYSSTLHNDGG